MTNETQLIYPTLDLFLYDLRKGLGQNDEKLNQKRRNFWEKIYGKNLDDNLLKELAKAEKEGAIFVNLHKENNHFIDFLDQTLDGYYYPVQLGDMFALQVDCSGNYVNDQNTPKNTPNYNPQPISNLSKIKKQINNQIQGNIQGNIQGTIGQTWMMYAQLSENLEPNQAINQMKEVAQQCYKELEPNGNWENDFYAQGKFFGATVFEFWHSSDNPKDIDHLLIWLFPKTDQINSIRENVTNIYVDLMKLFSCRHKMIWAYQQSQSIKPKIENGYAEIMTCVNAITQISVGAKHSGAKSLPPTNNLSAGMLRPDTIDSQSLPPTNNSSTAMLRPDTIGIVTKNQDKLDLELLENKLKDSLSILSHYAVNLRELKAQGGTIRVNLDNYQVRLKTLSNKDNSNDKDLSFLSDFSELAKVRYQEQIIDDYDNLSPGLTLLENLIRTIEGIIEIEQTKSERALNTTIFIASSVLGTSGVASSIISSQVKIPSKSEAYSPNVAFWLSIGIGLVPLIPFIIFKSLKIYRRFRRRITPKG
ncbi:hypothetical protein BCD67_15660 [Oscillatoriales cyanobacterium USR001]|nr:hypothetical protein BCD67_15660 [Oscillatoriales cyanobacterium USR001]